ncbi:DegT/DnrJ/EryC1/StrS family aminotransferase, partial [bacterium]|nr:DegT/DnrJ/EryC1/StrS family aminotransferase [bacterium]
MLAISPEIKPFEEPIYVTRPLLPDIKELTGKLEEIWDAKWLTNSGPQHVLLEEMLSKTLRVPNTSLFNNGTIALMTACQSLRLSGEVITTPFTFPATPHVLSWNNIKPVFCDIDPGTMNIDAQKIESMITPETTAIMPVHVFGTPCDVVKIQEIADRYSLKVIYDAAHAFGVEFEGQGIGNFGDISMFSFHATKLFHTAEGGALTFKDTNMKARIDLLKNFGIKNEEEVVMPGINGKMNEIQAALGLVNLELV